MSAHDCKTITPGCYRCDLNLDEADGHRQFQIESGWIEGDNGEWYGHCNACGEEREELAECCDDGEVVPNE